MGPSGFTPAQCLQPHSTLERQVFGPHLCLWALELYGQDQLSSLSVHHLHKTASILKVEAVCVNEHIP